MATNSKFITNIVNRNSLISHINRTAIQASLNVPFMCLQINKVPYIDPSYHFNVVLNLQNLLDVSKNTDNYVKKLGEGELVSAVFTNDALHNLRAIGINKNLETNVQVKNKAATYTFIYLFLNNEPFLFNLNDPDEARKFIDEVAPKAFDLMESIGDKYKSMIDTQGAKTLDARGKAFTAFHNIFKKL